MAAGQYDAKADIWSIGCIFYEMLAGQVPFGGVNETDLLNNIRTKELRAPADVSPVSISILRRVRAPSPIYCACLSCVIDGSLLRVCVCVCGGCSCWRRASPTERRSRICCKSVSTFTGCRNRSSRRHRQRRCCHRRRVVVWRRLLRLPWQRWQRGRGQWRLRVVGHRHRRRNSPPVRSPGRSCIPRAAAVGRCFKRLPLPQLLLVPVYRIHRIQAVSLSPPPAMAVRLVRRPLTTKRPRIRIQRRIRAIAA